MDFDPVFKSEIFPVYAFWGTVLSVKILLMSLITVYHRRKSKAQGKTTPELQDNIERVRRAYRNDLENIPVFIIISFIYQLTNPSVFLATNLIRLFGVARIAHTIVYAIVPVKQPARFLIFLIAMVINVFMGYSSVRYFFLINK